MFVERTRTVAASADAGIVGSQVRIEIQIVTRHCRGVDLVSYDARTSALRQASCHAAFYNGRCVRPSSHPSPSAIVTAV